MYQVSQSVMFAEIEGGEVLGAKPPGKATGLGGRYAPQHYITQYEIFDHHDYAKQDGTTRKFIVRICRPPRRAGLPYLRICPKATGLGGRYAPQRYITQNEV